MKNTQQEYLLSFNLCRLQAISEMIEEYAYKNRAKIVQRLLELKHQLEQNLGLNRSLQAQYGLQNPVPKGLLLGELTHHNKGGQINGSSSTS